MKDRYSEAVHQVALRSLHEVFEADRRGLVRSISLEVGTETIDPATGTETHIPFVAVAAEREAFTGFDLRSVVPAATLKYLGAAVSKNPFGLAAADVSGIRKA
jgi:restriction system protein